MLSKTCSIALLALAMSAASALAQPDNTANRAPTEAPRDHQDAGPVARQNDDRDGPAINQDELEREVRPEDPEIDTGVYEPTDFTAGPLSPTQVALRWWNRGAPQTRISRTINGGPWMPLQTLGPLPTGAYFDFRDEAAASDAEICYRLSVSDGINLLSAQTTPVRCVMTPDGRDRPARRVQLRIAIANADGAGTDDTIEARLQPSNAITPASTNWRPAGNSTWIDSTSDDFERSSNRTYDLLTANVSQASDVTGITLLKPGDDDVCVAALELFIDNRSAYSRSYGNGPSGCRWIRGDNVLSVGFDELRAHTSWRNLSANPLFTLDGPGLRSVIEANFGHFLHGRGRLRNATLSTTYVNRQRVSVSVPVTVYDAPILGDVDSRIRFDLVLTEIDGEPDLSIENVDADSNDLLVFLMPILSSVILYGVSEEIEAQIEGMNPADPAPSSAPDTYICFTDSAGIGICYDGT